MADRKTKKTTRKKTNTPKHNNPKGKLLEQIVAALYQTPGVEITTNVAYPSTSGKRTREIDILLKTNVLGLPVEYAFQCKNEEDKIGVGKLSQFYGDLDDTGIPAKNGIFVSINGFTKGALDYAEERGIKTLILKGLTEDRLKSAVNSAIQHNVYLIPRLESFSLVNSASQSEHEYQFAVFQDENQKLVGSFLDLIFNKWRNGEIQENLGKHKIELDVPINWFQFYKGNPLAPMKLTLNLSVLAVIITIEGAAENHILLDAQTQKLEKSKMQVNFQGFNEGDEIPLTVISSEKELNDFLEKSGNIRLTTKVRLPRIISNNTYYPLSQQVAEKVFIELQKYRLNPDSLTQDKFDEILFDVSKNDLFREGRYNLLGKLVSVIVYDNDGNLIDLSLFAGKGDFEKVISLKDKYIENPSDVFRNMLAWAYERKSQQLLDNARQRKINQDELLKKSLECIKVTVDLEESFAALKQMAEILLMLKDYNPALIAVERALTKQKDEETDWLRLYILLKLKMWTDASKLLKILEKSVFDANDINLKAYQVELLHGQEKYKKAWTLVFESWQHSPVESTQYYAGTEFIDDLICKFLTVESRWFHIELLLFRATKLLIFHEYEESAKLADYAIVLLDDIKLVGQMEKPPLASGKLREEVLEGNLIRIVKLLSDTNNQVFAEKYITKIRAWFKRTYNEDPLFLND